MTFRVSRWQLTLLVFLVSLCVTPFSFDSLPFVSLRRFAWMVMVPATAVGLIGAAIALALLRRFPGRSVTEYAPQTAGPLLGRLYLALLGLVLLAGAPANLHTLVELARFSELSHISPLWIAFLFAGMVSTACYFGPEVVARVAEVLAPIVALGLIGVYAAPLPAAIPVRLLPLAGFPWHAYLAPAIISTLAGVRGFLCVLVLGGMVDDTCCIGRFTFGAVLLAALLSTMSLAEPVMVLGSGLASRLRFPLLAVIGTVSFRWLPFQRLTTVVIVVWELVMYAVFAFYLWSGVHVLTVVVGMRRNWRTVLFPAAAIAAFLAGASIRRPLYRAGLIGWDFSVIGVGVLLPLLLLALGRRRPRPVADGGRV